MSYQIFISYRRDGGDVTAKLICEALKNKGYTVFYDYDSLKGGVFDSKILKSIDECQDVVLVLPKNALTRCKNENDWVRQEIRRALEKKKNIIPVMMDKFEFPKKLPADIQDVARYNGVRFSMDFFESVIDKIIEKLTQKTVVPDNTGLLESDCNSLKTDDFNGTLTESKARKLSPDESGTVKIPDYVKVIGQRAFNCRKDIKKVILPDGVVKIEDSAFNACHYLEEINIPSTVERIEDDAFARCFMLKSLFLPDGIKEIRMGMCQHCSRLSELRIPETVTSISRIAFWYCYRLKTVSLPSSVTEIDEEAFDGCPNIELLVPSGSYAEKYALSRKIKFINYPADNNTEKQFLGITTKKQLSKFIRTIGYDDVCDIVDNIGDYNQFILLHCPPNKIRGLYTYLNSAITQSTNNDITKIFLEGCLFGIILLREISNNEESKQFIDSIIDSINYDYFSKQLAIEQNRMWKKQILIYEGLYMLAMSKSNECHENGDTRMRTVWSSVYLILAIIDSFLQN